MGAQQFAKKSSKNKKQRGRKWEVSQWLVSTVEAFLGEKLKRFRPQPLLILRLKFQILNKSDFSKREFKFITFEVYTTAS